MAMIGEQHLTKPLPFKVLKTPAIEAMEALPVDMSTTWMMQVLRFLTKNKLPKDEFETKQLIKKSSKYALLVVGCIGGLLLNHGCDA